MMTGWNEWQLERESRSGSRKIKIARLDEGQDGCGRSLYFSGDGRDQLSCASPYTDKVRIR